MEILDGGWAPIGGSVRVDEFKRKTAYCKNARTYIR